MLQSLTARLGTSLIQLVTSGLIIMTPAISVAATSLYQLNTSLVDESGRHVTLKQWHGKPALITMEYASCQFICSAAVSTLMNLQRHADDEHLDIEFIIISLDPDHDTPDAWRHYRQLRKLTRSNWHYLTPSRQDLPMLANLLGIRYWHDGEILMHDFRILRVNATGETISMLESYGGDWHALLMNP